MHLSLSPILSLPLDGLGARCNCMLLGGSCEARPPKLRRILGHFEVENNTLLLCKTHKYFIRRKKNEAKTEIAFQMQI